MIITEIQYFFSKIIRFQAIFKDTVEFTCALEFKISSQLFHLLITEKDGTVLNISAADKFTICRPEMRLSMDYNQNQNNEMNQNIPQIDPKYRGLSIASMVCGICSLVLCCTGLLSIPAGALGILFALLTRKRGQRMNNMCVAGIWLSCVGLALGIFITVSSIVTVFTDPSYMNMLDQMYQQMYGVDMEEFWQSYL